MALDLALAKQHLRVDGTHEDTLITGYLAAAIAWVENHTGKKLTRGSVSQEVPALSGHIRLDWGPTPASVSVAYIDTDDAAQTFTDVTIAMARVFGEWPTIQTDTSAVITYPAGFSTGPDDLVSAGLFMVGHFHANREAVSSGAGMKEVPFGIEALCRPYRQMLV